jgi:hypothetical protein
MPNPIGGLPFAQEALADLAMPRELGVQHLHRDAPAVAVLGGVNGGHTANAEQTLQAILVAKSDA